MTLEIPAGTPRPAAGDVLISPVNPEGSFEISAFPGRPQFTAATYDEAFGRADAFASKLLVDVWKTKDGVHFHHLAQHRASQAITG